jgi:hypothetical protein
MREVTMGDISPRMRFAEEIRQLIHENFGPGYPSVIDDASVVNRRQVEAIGRSLGMTEGEACRNFWALQGELWDVHTKSMARSLIAGGDDPEEPGRRWLVIKDVILLGP